MPSREPPADRPLVMQALLLSILRERGTAEFVEAIAMLDRMDAHLVTHPNAPLQDHLEAGIPPKWVTGIKLLRDDPSKWFRDTQIDDRDLALINASPVPWVEAGQQSFLKHVHHKLKDQPIKTTPWTVENDKALRCMISEVGGAGFTGLAKPPVHLPAPNWEHMMVNVNITGNIAPGVTWGLLSGKPSTARILAGPCETCAKHPWDLMILRDFHTNTSGLDGVAHIASRQFDILLMKMCKDMDYPWVVLAVKDSGPVEIPEECCSPDGQCNHSCLGF
ncbi:hypothetical protein F5883DRAFT_610642 [Diaporthe sp. PMI_573]|nr:hypothetical protein F5883DRAFT_610642 [Diaporthaceae sp. PMI_573]